MSRPSSSHDLLMNTLEINLTNGLEAHDILMPQMREVQFENLRQQSSNTSNYILQQIGVANDRYLQTAVSSFEYKNELCTGEILELISCSQEIKYLSLKELKQRLDEYKFSYKKACLDSDFEIEKAYQVQFECIKNSIESLYKLNSSKMRTVYDNRALRIQADEAEIIRKMKEMLVDVPILFSKAEQNPDVKNKELWEDLTIPLYGNISTVDSAKKTSMRDLHDSINRRMNTYVENYLSFINSTLELEVTDLQQYKREKYQKVIGMNKCYHSANIFNYKPSLNGIENVNADIGIGIHVNMLESTVEHMEYYDNTLMKLYDQLYQIQEQTMYCNARQLLLDKWSDDPLCADSCDVSIVKSLQLTANLRILSENIVFDGMQSQNYLFKQLMELF